MLDVFKKNLVVFCSMTNLNYVCVGDSGLLWTHLSLCLSVCLLLSIKLFNVLTLIDTTLKKSSLLRVK